MRKREAVAKLGTMRVHKFKVFPWLNTCTCTICTQQGEIPVTSGEDHIVINDSVISMITYNKSTAT